MKRAYILVQGQLDVDLLRKVLPPDSQRNVEFVVAGGGGSSVSLARSLLVRRRVPVAVLIDADSLNPDAIQELRENAEELVTSVAGSVPVRIIVVVPTIESVFFAVPDVIERVIGVKVPTDLLAIGARDPRGILNLLAETAKSPWDVRRAIAELTPDNVARIQSKQEFRELAEFLQGIPDATATPATVG